MPDLDFYAPQDKEIDPLRIQFEAVQKLLHEDADDPERTERHKKRAEMILVALDPLMDDKRLFKHVADETCNQAPRSYQSAIAVFREYAKATTHYAGDQGLKVYTANHGTLSVTRDKVTFDDQSKNDIDACVVSMRYAKTHWKGRAQVAGNDAEFRINTWAAAKHIGVKLSDCPMIRQERKEAKKRLELLRHPPSV
jgi:hypothetical protein